MNSTRRAGTMVPGASRALVQSFLALALLALPLPLLGSVPVVEAAAVPARLTDAASSIPVQEAGNPQVEAEASGSDEVRRAWLGVEVQRLDSGLRDAFEFDGSGVLVGRVVLGSPAREAGIQEGDILVAVDGRRVRRPSDLRKLIARYEPGDRVQVERFREGETREVSVRLAARSERQEKRGSRPAPGPVPPSHHPDVRPFTPELKPFLLHGHLDQGYLGTRVARLGADLADYFEVNPDSGILVLEVEEDSPASKAGLRAGDVIVRFDGERVRTPGELTRAVRSEKPGTAVTLTVVRHGRDREIEVTLSGLPGVERMRDLASRGRQEIAPLLDDLGERLGEGREELSERLERLEELVEELRRKFEERGD